MGIGDWGLGPIPNPQSPIPNPQSPMIHQIYKLHSKNFIINIKVNENYFSFNHNNIIF